MRTGANLTGLKAPARASQPSAFIDNVMALLERTEYRRCDASEDLEAIFRLRYKAYRTFGFVEESADQVTFDELDATPNCNNFAIYIDDNLISTVRLHQIDSENPYGPVMKAFGDVMEPRIQRGESCINPSMFAADPELAGDYRALPYVSLRLVVVAYAYFNSTYCGGLIRQEHTGFYRRVFGAHQATPPRTYPPISVPLMLYEAECAREFAPTVARFPFFLSTRTEQRMLFEPSSLGKVMPLTVLPTAKYLRAA